MGGSVHLASGRGRRIRLIEGNTSSLRLKSNLEKDFAAAGGRHNRLRGTEWGDPVPMKGQTLVLYIYSNPSTGESVELEIMPLNTSWIKQETKMFALASFFLYEYHETALNPAR
jgi:hypothetical protein